MSLILAWILGAGLSASQLRVDTYPFDIFAHTEAAFCLSAFNTCGPLLALDSAWGPDDLFAERNR